MEFTVVVGRPDATPLLLIRSLHEPVVGLLGFSGFELLARVAYPFDPPVLTSGSYASHVIVELCAEYVVEVCLTQFSFVDQIAWLLNRKTAGISGSQSLRPFRLHLSQVTGRGQAYDHLAVRRSKLAKLTEILLP